MNAQFNYLQQYLADKFVSFIRDFDWIFRFNSSNYIKNVDKNENK